MYRSSVSLNAPPSPRRRLSAARSAIVRRKGIVVVKLAFVAVIDKSKVPNGDAGLVMIWNFDRNRAGPFAGEKVHTVSAGHPDTLRETGSDEVPYTRTSADAV